MKTSMFNTKSYTIERGNSMKTRMYHLIVRNTNSGIINYLTRYPMSHAECMVMKSKGLNPARIELLEVTL